jgi:hypothetical protein
MLTDPNVLSVAGVNTNLPKVRTFPQKSVYKTDDETLTFTVSHQDVGGGKTTQEARTRRMVRLDRRATVVNPVSLQNEIKSSSVYLVIDEPEIGFSDAQLIADVVTLNLWLTTSSNANTAKVLTDQH